MKLKKLGLN
uniref:Uncharacterized protein n=1 Tax=Arundo donax TaxID=35708 RepID=A0A0A9HBY7_ARUDO